MERRTKKQLITELKKTRHRLNWFKSQYEQLKATKSGAPSETGNVLPDSDRATAVPVNFNLEVQL